MYNPTEQDNPNYSNRDEMANTLDSLSTFVAYSVGPKTLLGGESMSECEEKKEKKEEKPCEEKKAEEKKEECK